MDENESQSDDQENSEQENNIPEWLKEYERRYHTVYQELMKTNAARNKQHEQALAALYEAVDAANRVTLNFLGDNSSNESVQKEDSPPKK